MIINISRLILFMFLVISLTGCLSKEQKKPELLLYTGIIMAPAVTELADTFCEQEDCTIMISKGGSGTLAKSIEHNQYGDIFFSGNENFLPRMRELGLVDYEQHVGYNIATLMVQKGNPKNISNDLRVLANPEYYVILGNPESASIGQETQVILEEYGIFEEVIDNTRRLTPDSKDLNETLVKKEADVVLNWYASVYTYDSHDDVTVLPISHDVVSPNRLIMTRLSFTEYPELAKKFIDFSHSKEGQEILEKHGLGLTNTIES
ncbi:molybdate ABC transporter substrate-binding protein [Bacillus sp. FJAT-45350]|uniref:molybdate ABC transporter substrate-binding protein n=1 Tax=Bacillus sp. FJAT-45350 TaxID=2011014 RepID=UPI000BB950E6|nr:molybdate ABC transporter substrate-binding protein [Bacillus sp. FJAT-45350]